MNSPLLVRCSAIVPEVYVGAGAAKEKEGLLGGELVSLHQDAFGLAYDLPGNQRFAELIDFLGVREGHGGVRGDKQADLLGFAVEGIGAGSVEIQRAEPVTFHEQLTRKHAPCPEFHGAPREFRPAVLPAEVLNTHHPLHIGCIQTGTLPGGALQGIDLAWQVS